MASSYIARTHERANTAVRGVPRYLDKVQLVSWNRSSLTYSRRGIPLPTPTRWETRVGGPGLAALLIAHLCPINSLFAPCDPGAAPGIFVTELRFQDTSCSHVARWPAPRRTPS